MIAHEIVQLNTFASRPHLIVRLAAMADRNGYENAAIMRFIPD